MDINFYITPKKKTDVLGICVGIVVSLGLFLTAFDIAARVLGILFPHHVPRWWVTPLAK